jgi:hypothetical protein
MFQCDKTICSVERAEEMVYMSSEKLKHNSTKIEQQAKLQSRTCCVLKPHRKLQ